MSANLEAPRTVLLADKHVVVTSNGSEIGTLKHLPPTLMVQYHLPMGDFRPYAGLGLNATNFSDVQFSPAVVSAIPDPSLRFIGAILVAVVVGAEVIAVGTLAGVRAACGRGGRAARRGR